jgi:AAA ATPase domain
MSLGDRLQKRAVEALTGRRAELERFEAFALGDEPLVMHIQGIPGIGKSHLLNALAASIAERGVFVVRIDARWCEPSPAALCRAISKEMGASESADPAVLATSLSDVGRRTLLVLDSYESFRLLDSWLRQVFLPSLGDSVRTILSSREPPRPAWSIAPAWRGLFDSMLLETFSPEMALEYLTSEGVPDASARELNRIARGHPLALSLGLALHFAGGQVRGSAATRQEVLEHIGGAIS